MNGKKIEEWKNNALLVELLQEMTACDEPLSVNLDDIDDLDKMILIAKCCSWVLTTTICALSETRAEAFIGLDSLLISMKEFVGETRIYDDKPIRH